MEQPQDDHGVQERLSQLNSIIASRNDCLRELYTLLHWKPDTEHVLEDEDTENDEMHAFLSRFNIQKDLHQGSIDTLEDEEISNAFQASMKDRARSESLPSETIVAEEARTTRSKSRTAEPASSTSMKPPSQAKRKTSSPSAILTETEDEAMVDTEVQRKDAALQEALRPAPLLETPLQVASTVVAVAASSPPTTTEAKTTVSVKEEVEDDVMQVEPPEEKDKTEDVEMKEEADIPPPHPSEPPTLPTAISPALLMNVPLQQPSTSPVRPAVPAPTNLSGLEKASTPLTVPNLDPPHQVGFQHSAILKGFDASAHQRFSPEYTLPPIGILPAEFTRKAKSKAKKSQREREKEKGEAKSAKDDILPMGLNRWNAIIGTNPAYKRLGRATKTLSTRDWNVAMTELRYLRAAERIETLKSGRWSFRQPKKQRGVGGLQKTHWDYLLDEMKWMRIDFREERKWKLALAYHLSTAVLEWHAAGTPEERLRLGICVKWQLHRNAEEEEETAEEEMIVEEEQPKRNHSLLGVDYGSEEEDDDEQEKEQRSVADALEPSSIVEDALDTTEEMHLKNEEIDDSSMLALPLTEKIEGEDVKMDDAVPVDTNGLKTSSADPLLGSKSSSQTASANGDAEPPPTKPSKSSYAPLRDKIIYSNDDELFAHVGDFQVGANPSDVHHVPQNIDWSTLFPELQPYGLLDVPAPSSGEGKKKAEKRSDRDDPNKRAEDTTYSKLYPSGRFMFSKPTLLGPLEPAKRWSDGKWLPTVDSQVSTDLADAPSRLQEDVANDLYDGRSTAAVSTLSLQGSSFKDKQRKSSVTEHLWSQPDDTLLKSLIDKYSMNWNLIAECYNASRLTTPTDRKTPQECFERWKERWGPATNKPNLAEVASTAEETGASSSGVSLRKRSTTATPNLNTQAMTSSNDSKKRRRHILLQDSIRKLGKRRAENAQRTLATKKASSMHETHLQYNKLPKYTPAELSRLKAEKDVREVQEQGAFIRARQEDRARQILDQRQRQAGTGQPSTPSQAQAQPSGSATSSAATPQPAVPPTTQSAPVVAVPAPVAQAPATPTPAPAVALPSTSPVVQQTPQTQVQLQIAQLQQIQQLQNGQQAQQRASLAASIAGRTRMAASTPAAVGGRPIAQPGQRAAMQIPVAIPSATQPTTNGTAPNIVNAGYYNIGGFTQEQLMMLFQSPHVAQAVQQQQQQQAQQQQQQQQQLQQQQQNQSGGSGGSVAGTS